MLCCIQMVGNFSFNLHKTCFDVIFAVLTLFTHVSQHHIKGVERKHLPKAQYLLWSSLTRDLVADLQHISA